MINFFDIDKNGVASGISLIKDYFPFFPYFLLFYSYRFSIRNNFQRRSIVTISGCKHVNGKHTQPC